MGSLVWILSQKLGLEHRSPLFHSAMSSFKHSSHLLLDFLSSFISHVFVQSSLKLIILFIELIENVIKTNIRAFKGDISPKCVLPSCMIAFFSLFLSWFYQLVLQELYIPFISHHSIRFSCVLLLLKRTGAFSSQSLPVSVVSGNASISLRHK